MSFNRLRIKASTVDLLWEKPRFTTPRRTYRGPGQPISAIQGLMVLRERIELSTSPLPRECSTTELRQPNAADFCHIVPAAQACDWLAGKIRHRQATMSFSGMRRRRKGIMSDQKSRRRGQRPTARRGLPRSCAPICRSARRRRGRAATAMPTSGRKGFRPRPRRTNDMPRSGPIPATQAIAGLAFLEPGAPMV